MARQPARVFPFFSKSVVIFVSFLYGTFFSLALGYPSELTWTLSSSVGYDQGSYGTNSQTSTLNVPVSLKVGWGEIGDLEGTISYIHQTSRAGVTIVNGVPIRVSGRTGVETTDGMGDINLKGRYFALPEGSYYPGITPTLGVKFPTADRDKNLGTGKFDYELGLELHKTFEPIVLFLNGSYTFMGDPPAQRLNDRKAWGAGVQWNMIESIALTGSISGSNALVKGNNDPLAASLSLSYNFTKSFGISISGTKGLSDGSPDFGVTTGLSWTISP